MHRLIGHAIVSADDRIADASGAFPEALRNQADFTRFQAELDAAHIVVLGRHTHEAAPNVQRRQRLVVSRSAKGLEAREDGWWLNPLDLPLMTAIDAIVPNGATVAVPGGQGVFDLVGPGGFTAFHLARAHRVRLGRGRGLFAACERGVPASEVFAGGGLVPDDTLTLDPDAHVTLTVWRRPEGDGARA